MILVKNDNDDDDDDHEGDHDNDDENDEDDDKSGSHLSTLSTFPTTRLSAPDS